MRNTSIYQEYSRFREVIPREICPFCPVFFGRKIHNSSLGQEIDLSTSLCPDIDDKSPFLRAYPLYLS